MGNALRGQPFHAAYKPLKTPVLADDVRVGILVAFGIIAFSFLLIVPGIRGMERCWACIRVFVALWIGAVILVCNYGSWYSDTICTRTQYLAHTEANAPQLIQAQVGLSIGLRGVNITLLATACNGDEDYDHNRPFQDEIINYEEQFSWANPWSQGRLDFGIYGGRFNQEYRAAKHRGIPYPILWIAEYFTLDGEQILWYRKFRVAGWYTHILLWAAFGTYLLSIALFVVNIRWGALHMLITGILMMVACLTYGVTIVNNPPLQIHFPDGTLVPQFNWAFWLVLATGCLTALAAIVIVFIDKRSPRMTAEFFHHSTIEDDAIFQGGEVDTEDEPGLDQFGIVTRGRTILVSSRSIAAPKEAASSDKPRRYRRYATTPHLKDAEKPRRYRRYATAPHLTDAEKSHKRCDDDSRENETKRSSWHGTTHQLGQRKEIQLEEITVH